MDTCIYMQKLQLAKQQKGFTLVEISIVIVIIGLIITGVTAGQSLVTAARIRSMMTDVSKYSAAIITFKLAYNQYPGDYTKAFSTWGSVNGCTNNDTNVVAGGCNGDGDGQVLYNAEGYMAWVHMNKAGVLPNNYTGNRVAGNNDIGSNTPRTAYKNGGLSLQIWKSWHNKPVGNMFQFAAERNAANNQWDDYAIVTVLEAYAIDTKFDDGSPATGMVYAGRGNDYFWDGTRCINKDETQSPWTGVSYLFTDTSVSCRMYFFWM